MLVGQESQYQVDEKSGSVESLQGVILIHLEHEIDAEERDTKREKTSADTRPERRDDDNEVGDKNVENRDAEQGQHDGWILPSKHVKQAEHKDEHPHILGREFCTKAYPIDLRDALCALCDVSCPDASWSSGCNHTAYRGQRLGRVEHCMRGRTILWKPVLDVHFERSTTRPLGLAVGAC